MAAVGRFLSDSSDSVCRIKSEFIHISLRDWLAHKLRCEFSELINNFCRNLSLARQ